MIVGERNVRMICKAQNIHAEDKEWAAYVAVEGGEVVVIDRIFPWQASRQ
jgi:hypothetical protein